ncbi:MAG: hypothetical protein ACK4MD_09985 [Demequina sp.]
MTGRWHDVSGGILRKFVYTAVATFALVLGVAIGWTWQQWQPAPALAATTVETAG